MQRNGFAHVLGQDACPSQLPNTQTEKQQQMTISRQFRNYDGSIGTYRKKSPNLKILTFYLKIWLFIFLSQNFDLFFRTS